MLRTRTLGRLILALAAASGIALAQRPVQPPPAAKPPAPTPAAPAPGERQISPSGDSTPANGKGRPSCEETRRKGKWGIYFSPPVEIDKLVQAVADATCKTFILTENVRGKISIIGPENGKAEVDADAFYAAFLNALDANGWTVAPSGRFLKIVEKRGAKQSGMPLSGEGEEYGTTDQMVTKIFKVRYVDVEPLRAVLQQFATKDGDCIPYQPDTLICTDLGSNMKRLERMLNQLDARSANDEIRIIQIHYAPAQDVANTIQKIFESKGGRPGSAPGGGGRPLGTVMPPPGSASGPGGADSGGGSGGGGPITLSQLIPDERTNKLIVVASPSAFERIVRLIAEIDVPTTSGGGINVYALENANAEDMAGTLQSLAQGTANKSGRGSSQPPPGVSLPPGVGPRQGTTAELFSGEVKVSADKATNSLVIIANQADYRNMVRVIQKLDVPRRQVFVEAVIMEVNLDRDHQFGVGLHQGLALNGNYNGSQVTLPALFATKYSDSGLPPSLGLDNLLSFSGFLAGIQGPIIPEIDKLGLKIPAFGVVLHALQVSSDVNVLSTPHILTSDNEEAEITVGQNVPFQAGFAPGNLSALTGGAGGAAGALGGLTGLGNFFAPINRQNVELKLTIKPQINESDYIRLVISEQTEEIASQDRVLGPTTSKRSAKTTVVAKNQETVVIGGIMQDRTIDSVRKVPILGDLPILGHLFRESERKKVKTNLLLFLTPYIIRDQSDFRAIFDRKMKERQQFVEEFYGQVPGYETSVDFSRKAGPLARLNQAVLREEEKMENGGPGAEGERMIQPMGGSRPSRPADTTEGPAPENGPAGSPESVPPPDAPSPAEREKMAPPGPEVKPPPGDFRP
ncbi:MAG TPA: type II secretion system secretin GspD [Myxococcaceae bacterium]|nr:type II secretion system secretin GspD [Myxococcaceae bacterium]